MNQSNPKQNIFIENLPLGATPKHLCELIEPMAEIFGIRIMPSVRGKGKGDVALMTVGTKDLADLMSRISRLELGAGALVAREARNKRPLSNRNPWGIGSTEAKSSAWSAIRSQHVRAIWSAGMKG